MKPLPGQSELLLVIAHNKVMPIDTHKPKGIRLATLLRDYDKSPSSETWSKIQKLSTEILKCD